MKSKRGLARGDQHIRLLTFKIGAAPMTDPFEAFADKKRWVVWREEERGGKPTKVPYSARSGRLASATDPATWATRREAEDRAQVLLNGGPKGGLGITLGAVPFEADGGVMHLCGVDFDSCLDENQIAAGWAAEIVAALATYTEISPSGRGLKSFFFVRTGLVRQFLDLIGVAADAWGCRRSIPGHSGADHGPAIEIYTARRYFTVTGQTWGTGRQSVAKLDWGDLEALAALVPAAARDTGNGVNGEAGTRDNSRSAKAWRAAFAYRDASYEEMCEGLRNHDDPQIRDWVREKGEPHNERGLRRLWERGVTDGPGGESVQTDIGPRPVVQVSGGELPTVIDLAEQILIDRDPGIFAFGDKVVRPAMQPIHIADNKKTRGLRLVTIATAHMVERFTRHVDFQKFNLTQRKWLSIDCPHAVAEAYLQRIGLWQLPQLSALTTCPLLLPDGRILERPGYDADSGVLFDPQGVVFPAVPTAPSPEEGRAALDQLLSPFAEFPFVDDKARAVLTRPCCRVSRGRRCRLSRATPSTLRRRAAASRSWSIAARSC
jgi:hypothetical protein